PMYLFCQRYSSPSDLRSFPTRRSSDLAFCSLPAVIVPMFAEIEDRVDTLRLLAVIVFDAIRDPVIVPAAICAAVIVFDAICAAVDRKSTRLNSSHVKISYAVFCLKKKT